EVWVLDLETKAVRHVGANDRMSRTSPMWTDDGRGLTYDVMEGPKRERRMAWFTPDFGKLVDEHKLEDPPALRTPRNQHPAGGYRPYVELKDGLEKRWRETE